MHADIKEPEVLNIEKKKAKNKQKKSPRQNKTIKKPCRIRKRDKRNTCLPGSKRRQIRTTEVEEIWMCGYSSLLRLNCRGNR